MPETDTVLRQLMAVICDRRATMPPDSYTTRLFLGGTAKIGSKITEEAGEVVDAALPLDAPIDPATAADRSQHRDHLIHEAADLVYHLLVMLAHHEVSLEDVEAKLADRFGMSGLAEKAARPPKNPS